MTTRDTQLWQRIRSVFETVLEELPDKRQAALSRACGTDEHLRREVESLLAAHDSEGRETPSPTVHPDRLFGAAASHAAEAMADVGPYCLRHRLGVGGFGEVWAAEQAAPVRRMVALKIIKLGMDTKQVIARFEAERQALALMDHPNIARVLDAGTTDTGRPYFVMELVDGVPITEFCDQERLTIRQRLELFIEVCQAVQHAHTKGVIHRDLKPSNVLVAMQDGKPTPKVIDFGIAKATNEPLTDGTLLTEARQLLGTPEYMSPEQAQLGVVDIDTRSDVYSLGVLLYELLTGCTPFDRRQLRESSIDELRRIIREIEPAAPSTRVSSLARRRTPRRQGSDPATLAPAEHDDSGAHPLGRASQARSGGIVDIARQRHADPSVLRRELTGDLDWIVMQCLEKDRTRRYETASALASDLRRHLAGDPVVAAPPSRIYRLRKFVGRNRGVAVTGTAVGLALLLGMAGTGVGWASSHRQARLERERADELTHVAFFFRSVIGGIPFRQMGESIRRQILDQRQRALELEELDPVMLAGEMEAFTAVLDDVNFMNVAMAAIETNIVDRLEQMVDDRFTDRPLIRAQMSHLIGGTRRRLGAAERAVLAEAHALKTVEDDFPENRTWRRDAHRRYARALSASRRYAEAAEQYLHALALAREEFGEDAGISLIRDLGLALHEDERIDESIECYLNGIEIARRMGDPGWELNIDLHLALSLADAGRVEEAEAIYRSNPPYDENDPDAPGREAWVGVQLGALLRDRGELDEPLPILRDALQYFRQESGEGAAMTMYCRHQLGLLHAARGELAHAHRLQADGCRHVREGTDDGDRQRAVFIHLRHAQTLTELGRFEEAERDLLDAQRLGETPGVLTWSSARARFAIVLPRAFVDLYEAWETAEPWPEYRERLAEWRRRLEVAPAVDGSLSIRRGSHLY